MHVLVTGATGFVGFHTVQALVLAGHTVRLGIRSVEKMRRVYEGTGIDTSDYEAGEITDEASVERALEGCEAVVHTAAVVNLDARHAEYVRKTNVRGTELVIGGAAARGIKSIVYVSSVTALYTAGAERIDEHSPLGNSDNGYGLSKVESERFVQKLQSQGTPIAITYPATIIGPNDPGMSEGSQGLSIFFNTGFVHTTSGMQIIDVRDLAIAHVRLLEAQKSGRYLVAGHFLPWADLGQLIDSITHQTLRRFTLPGALLRFVGRLMDFLMRIFRFETFFTLEAATYATQWVLVDDSKIQTELELEYRPLKDTLSDAISWQAQEGHIEPKWSKFLSTPR